MTREEFENELSAKGWFTDCEKDAASKVYDKGELLIYTYPESYQAWSSHFSSSHSCRYTDTTKIEVPMKDGQMYVAFKIDLPFVLFRLEL